MSNGHQPRKQNRNNQLKTAALYKVYTTYMALNVRLPVQASLGSCSEDRTRQVPVVGLKPL